MDSHRKLFAWQRCRRLTLTVYVATKRFPPDERYGLVSQLRTASVSACANIAEGCGRRGAKELKQFLNIALGSLAEVDALLDLSHALGYVDDETAERLANELAEAGKTTCGLYRNPGRDSR